VRRIVPVLLALFAVAGCSFTSNVSNCTNNVCAYTLNGAQGVDVEIGGTDRRMEVGPIGETSATVKMRGEEAELEVGDTADLDGLEVALVSLEGEEVKLLVREP
jgi:hypothetical protein